MTPLEVHCDDGWFAPKAEEATVRYRLPRNHALAELHLEVKDRSNASVLNERVLDLGLTQEVTWDGRRGDGGWVTPLDSPYTLVLKAVLEPLAIVEDFSVSESRPTHQLPCLEKSERVDDRREAEVVEEVGPTQVTIKVLYHSVELWTCPWEERFLGAGWDDDAKLCAALNRRGYYAGLPRDAGRRGADVERALRRFHFNTLAERSKVFDPVALAGLVEAAPPLLSPLTDDHVAAVGEGVRVPSTPMRVHVEALGFEADFDAKEDTDFEAQYLNRGNAQRWALEAARLNRPLVPLLAKVLVKAKGQRGGVDVPEAVGAVTVRWQAEEPDLDPAEAGVVDDWSQFSRPKTFLQRLYTTTKSIWRGTNCPVELGGARTSENPSRGVFCPGDAVHGFDLVAADAHLAVENTASVDPTRPDVLGASCVFFQPSYVGGDKYQLRVSLALPDGRADLVVDNGSVTCQTGVMQVWRRVRLAAIVGWPARVGGYGATVQHLKSHFRRAFLDVDDSAAQYVSAGDVIGAEDFRGLLRAAFALMQTDGPKFEPVVSDALSADGLFALKAEEAWGVSLGALQRMNSKVQEVVVRPLTDLQRALDEGRGLTVTEEYALSVIGKFVEKLLSMLVQIKGQEPVPALLARAIAAGLVARGAVHGGITLLDYQVADLPYAATLRMRGTVTTLSEGNHDLFALVDQRYLDGAGYVLTHEVGHCFMLRHHENVQRRVDTEADDRRDHDVGDHGCMMSYVKEGDAPCWPHQARDSYNAAFCGMCLLKLRGWNIHELAKRERAEEPVRVVGLFDQADPLLQGATEVSMIARATAALPFVAVRSCAFNRNAKLDRWAQVIDGADIYHHVTHGNQHCTRHDRRAASLWMFEPKYMLACASPEAARQLEGDEVDLHAHLLTSEPLARKRLMQATRFFTERYNLASGFWSYDHDLEGVFQWVQDDRYSAQDVVFHPAQVTEALGSVKKPPRLVFLSCCLAGWNGAMPAAFVKGGAEYVIAFRCRYNPGGQLMFPTLFYQMLATANMDLGAVKEVFRFVAQRYPDAEPTLFTKAGWTRTVSAIGESAFRSAFRAQHQTEPEDTDFRVGLGVEFLSGSWDDSFNLKSSFFVPRLRAP